MGCRWRLCACLLLLALIGPAAGEPLSHTEYVKTIARQPNKFKARRPHKDDAEKARGTSADGAANDEEPLPGVAPGACSWDLRLRWMTEVTSSVYSTPLITDLYDDGHKEVIVPSFVHYTEVLEGADGAKAAGWPAFHQSHVHASPLLYDVDKDGVNEVVVATYDGEILFFRDNGEQLPQKLAVPRLSVRREWYVGLKKDHTDHSKPDVQDLPGGDNITAAAAGAAPDPLAELLTGAATAGEAAAVAADLAAARAGTLTRRRLLQDGAPGAELQGGLAPEAAAAFADAFGEGNHGLESGDFESGDSEYEIGAGAKPAPLPPGHVLWGEPMPRLLQEGEADPDWARELAEVEGSPPESVTESGTESGTLSGTQSESESDSLTESEVAEAIAEGEAERAAAAAGQAGRPVPQEVPLEIARERQRAGAGGGAGGSGWDESGYRSPPHATGGSSDRVDVDAHILCTPAIGDLGKYGLGVEGVGGRGHALVVGVSYFFDREYYDDPAHASELPLPRGADLGKYVASGVVAFDLDTLSLMWSTHLDLTTEYVTERAYVYSAPTLVDLDGDKAAEVVLGTSVGFVYVLNGRDGTPRPGWPIQMADVQAQVAVGDVDDSGATALVAADAHGNVAVFDASGRELWERHLGSLVAQAASLGDVDGDGRTEVVVTTAAGEVHVLRGRDGAPLSLAWPFRTRGKIMAPATLTRVSGGPLPRGRRSAAAAAGASAAQTAALRGVKLTSTAATAAADIFAAATGRGQPAAVWRGSALGTAGDAGAPDRARSLQIVVASFDGFLYVIDGVTACAETADIGETSYGMVLADDLDNDGHTDLVLATMNGNVYRFEAGDRGGGPGPRERHHPLASWPSQVQAQNGFFARWGRYGILARRGDRGRAAEIAGARISVEFDIFDVRPLQGRYPNMAKLGDGSNLTVGAVEAVKRRKEDRDMEKRYHESFLTTPTGDDFDLEAARYRERLETGRGGRGPYHVYVELQGTGLGSAHGRSTRTTVNVPGRYTVFLDTPRVRGTGAVALEVSDRHGLTAVDSYAVAFHASFFRALKWLVALPAAGMCVALLAAVGGGGEPAGLALPS